MLSKQRFLQAVLSFTFILSISGFGSQATAINISLPNTTWIAVDKKQITSVDVYRFLSQTANSFSIDKFASFNFEQFFNNQERLILTQSKRFTSLHLPKHLAVIAFIQKPILPEPSSFIV